MTLNTIWNKRGRDFFVAHNLFKKGWVIPIGRLVIRSFELVNRCSPFNVLKSWDKGSHQSWFLKKSFCTLRFGQSFWSFWKIALNSFHLASECLFIIPRSLNYPINYFKFWKVPFWPSKKNGPFLGNKQNNWDSSCVHFVVQWLSFSLSIVLHQWKLIVLSNRFKSKTSVKN